MSSSEIRVAAVADLHMRPAVRGRFRSAFSDLADKADFLLLAGDLTNGGTLAEAELLRSEVADLPVAVIAVLGNHDHDEGHGAEVAAMLGDAGVTVLDATQTTLDVNGTRVGIAGVMGGGGGFPGYRDMRSAEDATPEHLARMSRGSQDAQRLRSVLGTLDCDVGIALMHFAPVQDTLVGEPTEIYWGLGCDELGDAVDKAGAHLVVHGHAHSGSEYGTTPGGIPVRNVAYPVLRRPYVVYRIVDGQVR